MAAIWSDPDFIAMRATAQRMFMFLLSQPDLSHAGLLPMRVNRWAKKAEDLTARTVRSELDYLAERDYVVVDEDTEDVLIRTMVRNDGVYKQPKVMIRMREDARQIESPMLRAAFRQELDRLPLHELSDRPGGPNADQPSTRSQVQAVVDTLRADFADVAGYPSAGVSDTPHVRAGAFHLPPTTVPQPPSTGHREKPLADESAEIDNRFDEFWDVYGKKVKRADAEKKWAKAIRKASPDRIIAAAGAYVAYERANNQGGRFIADPSTWLHGERWLDERTDLPMPQTRVQEHLALVQQLAAEEIDEQPTLPQIGRSYR
ncbi:MAG: hypothetical protein HOQ18_18335 [Dermatophilaceae bacterium]|nr:hypothetical protein [Dermatophilaceae bacterium]